MKRLMLALPLVVAACGDDVEPKLAECRDDIRAELTALVEKTKRDTAESLKAIESLRPSDSMIKAIPDMLAAAVPMMEVQLKAFEPTPAGLAQCQDTLAKMRQR